MYRTRTGNMLTYLCSLKKSPSVFWCGHVGPSVRRSVVIELESVKTHISAPAYPSATGIGRVSGLVFMTEITWKTIQMTFSGKYL